MNRFDLLNIGSSKLKKKNISFKNGFNILAKNILTPEDFLKFTQISDFNPTELVSDYKIESEKITEITYYKIAEYYENIILNN